MHTLPFVEYRCSCGRLLFKGLVLSGHVEVKCKRCSEVVLFDQPRDGLECKEEGTEYALLVGTHGYIQDASASALDILGYSRESLRTMTLHDIPALEKDSSSVTHLTTPTPLAVHVFRSRNARS